MIYIIKHAFNSYDSMTHSIYTNFEDAKNEVIRAMKARNEQETNEEYYIQVYNEGMQNGYIKTIRIYEL